MKPPLRSALIVLAAAGFVLIVALATVLLRPYRFHGMELSTPQPAKDFTLTGPGGKPVKLSDFQGKLVVLYFGYTYCPDVCPTTLADLVQAMQKLGKKADQVQGVMVTVDPDRDTPERLAEYVSYFNPTFVGLSGTPDQIAAAAAAYSIYYRKTEGTPANGYTVDHTATITVLDEEGRARLFWSFGTTADDMAADLAHLTG
jgi:protein SCO1/2